jgi:Putative Ig domain
MNSTPKGFKVEGPALKGVVSFGGGSVVTGSPHVYLVFWGSQWGSQSTGVGGFEVYSGDQDDLAPNLQAFFDGLGTNNESWSTIMTQYCQGVPAGTKTCPLTPSANHVAYPSATVLSGVWEDTSSSFTAATGAQIAQEAANAAVHFSNPPGAQYVIVSPKGTDPDQWLSPRYGYCAYHDNTGDFLGEVTGPNVPYTNMPYVPDVGAECSSFVDPGVLDGADETISHEYAETLSDPFPSSGWTDRQGNEIADKCENLIGGQPGGSTYLTLATGTFAVQGIWANDLGKRGGCENAHAPILTTDPGKLKDAVDVPVSLQIDAFDTRGRALSYTATDLPAGLSINTLSGIISGTPVARGRSATTVLVSDGSASTTIGFVWTIRR